MAKKTRNYREMVGEALTSTKKFMTESLTKRLGDPPESVGGKPQKNDIYRAYWKPAEGWEDPVAAQAKAAEMYAQGAKEDDVLKAMYPDRVRLIPFGDRADDIDAQKKFCDEMVAQKMEELAGQVTALRDQMNEEGPAPRSPDAVFGPDHGTMDSVVYNR